MKKLFTILAALFLCTCSWAQSKQQINNLSALAQVWGFLKYYHPAASKGTPDWDAELLKMIPKAKAVESQKEWEALIDSWYQSLPVATLAAGVTQPKGDSVYRIFSEKDVWQLPVSKSLKQTFLNLYNYHQPDSSIYFTDKYQAYKLDYVRHTEAAYEEQPYPSEELRLLSLFRYWNVINYFYPHKTLIAKDWFQVLPQYIPKILTAGDSTAYRLAVHQLTREIHDSHSFFQNDEWNKHYEYVAPFSIYYLDGKYVIGASRYDSLMKSHGSHIGDEIVAVNGKSVKQRERELLDLFSGTNELSKYRNVAKHLLSSTDSMAKVLIKRSNHYIEKEIGLYTEGFLYQQRLRNPKILWKQIEEGIWQVNFCSIRNPDTLQRLFMDIKEAKCVIWDMRDYPYFPVAEQMCRGFFNGKVHLEDDYNPSADFPGMFIRHSTYFESAANDSMPLFKGRLIVLVNEYTQSLAESVASNLRARNNTLVMGRQTAGTTGNITYFDLPGGIEVSYTAVCVKSVNNNFVQQQGVKIDKPIQLTAEKLRSSKDYVLDEAIKEAKN